VQTVIIRDRVAYCKLRRQFVAVVVEIACSLLQVRNTLSA